MMGGPFCVITDRSDESEREPRALDESWTRGVRKAIMSKTVTETEISIGDIGNPWFGGDREGDSSEAWP